MIARLAVAVAVVGATTTASASTVVALSPDQLLAGAELVVDATVVATATAWNGAGTGLETTVTLEIAVTHKGLARPTVDLVVAGGTIGGTTQIIVGMPAAGVGERARWFLRDRGDGRLAVYGWAQGKWPARQVGSATIYEPAPLAAERRGDVLEFSVNGMVWPAAWMPIPYLIQNAGSDDLTPAEVIATIDATFATWQAVPCSSLTFTNAGGTDLGMALDGLNVMMFIESGWVFGAEAAAATSLSIIDGAQTADIAMNGQRFTWAIGPAGSLAATTLDLQGVLTHEVGHFSGLSHTMRAFDTMYYSWTPWQGQRSLSIDDKLGLCSVYPVAGSECPAPACPPGEVCTAHPLGMLCEGTPDPIGSPCNYDRIECEDFCLFTQLDLSAGYCSRFCTDNNDCPATHHCETAMAGMTPVLVCFEGPPPPPDAAPRPDCLEDDACPLGQHCNLATMVCTFDCRTAADCGGGDRRCDDFGRCADGYGGCGCRTDEPAALALVLGGLAAAVLRRRRRRLPRV